MAVARACPVFAAVLVSARTAPPPRTIDCLLPHISTAPANAGEYVELFAREKVPRPAAEGRPAVLMINGATVSAVPVLDWQDQNYSGMEFLANAGFDVFAMDCTGYGLSPHPVMASPCNLPVAAQQRDLVPATLSQPCPPAYPYRRNTIQSEWDEIDQGALSLVQPLYDDLPAVTPKGMGQRGLRIPFPDKGTPA